MRRYETIFILRPDSGDPQIKEAIKRYEGIIAAGAGEMIETEEWGSRELAYKIKGERRGFYVRTRLRFARPRDERGRAQFAHLRRRPALPVGAGRRQRRRGEGARGTRGAQPPYRRGQGGAGSARGGSDGLARAARSRKRPTLPKK